MFTPLSVTFQMSHLDAGHTANATGRVYVNINYTQQND